ncbi:uncharacterized protein FA14DRAFT_187923 [Meira miltonrushii]|uniref:Zn(2)-C6 fungal-type domain-containing protein n=1 Tax=Meira miltonrushii TaxID=1280837 RepID=A0A316VN81_9BASI|nr:uncharacterized protein FA14DRAFT_187923 [Meira miltonrushii]PWN37873.1 hypothetical protein FA14DRAFT_187923 [Meira miltonrushii]
MSNGLSAIFNSSPEDGFEGEGSGILMDDNGRNLYSIAKDSLAAQQQQQQEPTKAGRKQGVSCDACKFRKVRCDRRSKLENKGREEDESQIACSVCSQHGLRCTFTQSAPRRRRGKRIVAIQRSQLEDFDDQSQATPETDNNNRGESSKSVTDKREKAEPLFGFDVEITEDQYQPDAVQLAERIRARTSKTSAQPNKALTTAQRGLFGVRGLTRALLDSCVRQYFKYAAPCQPILHVEVFSARYSLFFALFEENDGQLPLPVKSFDIAEGSPLSVLLILAVGCVGASFLEAPIAAPRSQAKFRLQDRIALRFQELLYEKELVTQLTNDGTDVIEACYIMSDPSLKVLGDDPKNAQFNWEEIIRAPIASRALLDPLRTSPSSAEAVVRLVFTMGLNRRPKPRKDCPTDDPRKWISGGIFITEYECQRRMRIFWSTFMQDSFRSFSQRKMVKIGDNDYDLDLPRFVPRPDGQYLGTMIYDRTNENATKDQASNDPYLKKASDSNAKAPAMTLAPSRFARFDALHLEVMLRLAFIIRTVTIRFVSPRAQGRGVLISDVEKATSSLQAWWSQRPSDVRWELQSEPLSRSLHEGKIGSNNALALRSCIKTLFLELLYHGNVLGIWSSIKDYDIRFEVDLNEAVHLFAARLGLDDNNANTSESVRESLKKLLDSSGNDEERKQKAKDEMDILAVRSFKRIAFVAKEAALLGIIRANRGVMLNVCTAYAVWGCNLAKKIAETGQSYGLQVPTDRHPVEYTFAIVNDILFAMASIDSYESAFEIVRQITGLFKMSQGEAKETAKIDFPMFTGRNAVFDHLLELRQVAGRAGTESSQYVQTKPNFHHFYHEERKEDNAAKGSNTQNTNKSSVSTGRESTLSPQQSSNLTSPSDVSQMDIDEVMQLARAALPEGYEGEQRQTSYNAQFMPISSGTMPGTLHNSNPITSPRQLYGPSLELDLMSITGMDSSWLQNYLQREDGITLTQPSTHNPYTSYDQNATQLSPSNLQQQQNLPVSSYGPSTSHQIPSVLSMPAQQNLMQSIPQQHAPTSFQSQNTVQPTSSAFGYVPENVHHPPHGHPAGLEAQWEQLMANAGDAQIWAESQWQGFSFVDPNQPPKF